jgi:hypothetical protein
VNPAKVNVHELIAWGLDEYSYRGFAIGDRQEEFSQQVAFAQRQLATQKYYVSCPPLLPEQTEHIRNLLDVAAQRIDLQEEYEGLDWMLGVVDLHRLLAFQRRLIFSPAHRSSPIPLSDDWPQLISLTLGLRRNTEHHIARNSNPEESLDISLYSNNPDLQLRTRSKDICNGRLPLSLYGGSPFFEVAEFHGRWFLRDGYHRAYRLLQAGVHRIPAVVIRAHTLEELGATKPWFFQEEQLFSDRPPRVVDFLDDSLVFHYEREALRKVIRIRIEESLEPFDETEEIQGEKL